MKTSLRVGLLSLLVLLLCATGPLFAETINISWQWDASDEDVVAFRYQLDAQDPDNWTVVDASVTEFVLGPVEDSSYHTLYLQQSYDGENWSASGELSYDPIEFGVRMPEESPETTNANEPEAVEEPVTIDEPEAVEEPVTIDEPEAVEEPVTIDEPEAVEEPVTIDEPEAVEEPVTIDEPEAVEEPVTIDEPEAVEEPMRISEPVTISEPVEMFEASEVESPASFDDFVVAEAAAVQEETPFDVLPEPSPVVIDPPRMRVDVFIGTGGKADNKVFTSAFDPDGDFATLRTMILPSITADFIYGNLLPSDSPIDIGLRAGLGYTGYELTSGGHLPGFDLHVMGMFEYLLSEKFALDASVGLAFMFVGDAVHSTPQGKLGFFAGPVVQINGKYRINGPWSVGVQAETRFLLGGAFKPYELTGIVRLGVLYDF